MCSDPAAAEVGPDPRYTPAEWPRCRWCPPPPVSGPSVYPPMGKEDTIRWRMFSNTRPCAHTHLANYRQRPERHRVGARREGPKGSRQVIHGVNQPAVQIDVEARGAALKAAGVEHHVVVSAVRQGGAVEAGGGKSAVSFLVTQRHWRRRKVRVRNRRWTQRRRQDGHGHLCSAWPAR